MSELKKVFISYSWDSETHKQWVLGLANRLEQYKELNVTLDQFDLDATSDKNQYMENAVYESDFILVVVTPSYKEKADQRRGGVGIETKLSSAKHWDDSLRKGQSKIIPILREGEQLPRYLNEKIYINFSEDINFEAELSNLLSLINNTNKAKRPQKKLSLSTDIAERDLTRIEDFLKINHKKRKLVFERSETTDYSANKRVKFELWETLSPSLSHYLFFFEHVTISDCVIRLCELVKRDNVKLENLTVLKTSGSEKDYLKKLFYENGVRVNLTELTYSEYIWDFCIDEEAKINEGVYRNPFFIDQPLVNYYDERENIGLSFDYLKKTLSEQRQSAAKIVIAPGGTGKTTLCQYLAQHFNGSDNSVSVMIQSEEVKSNISQQSIEKASIESVYDLYEIYAKVCGFKEDGEYVFDKLTFETALLTGKLVLIIDGMDELISLFPNLFNLEKFIESVSEINMQLGSSKILITSRNDVFDEKILERHENLNKFQLMGFDKNACERYLKRRFRKLDDKVSMTRKVMSYVEHLIAEDKNNRILPFIIDLLSSICEDSHENEGVNLDLNFDGKQYDSNEEITDYLVYSILRRESVRQSVEVNIEEILYIFLEIASYHNDMFPKDDLEEIIEVLYPEIASVLKGKVMRNPLIHHSGQYCRFKYDFISDYFKSLKIINSINKKQSSSELHCLLARYATSDNEVVKEVSKYYRNRLPQFINCANSIIFNLKKHIEYETCFSNSDTLFRAIGFFVKVLSALSGKSISKQDYTDRLKQMMGDSDNELTHLGIYGENCLIDFTNTKVRESRFISFKGFLSCKFGNSEFNKCYFDNSGGAAISGTFEPDMFVSCRLGDLEHSVNIAKENSSYASDLIESELRRFLASFYNRGKFKTQGKKFIKLSRKVRSIDNSFVSQLVKRHILEIVESNKSNDEHGYCIAKNYMDSVYGFINNNKRDLKIDGLLEMLNK